MVKSIMPSRSLSALAENLKLGIGDAPSHPVHSFVTAGYSPGFDIGSSGGDLGAKLPFPKVLQLGISSRRKKHGHWFAVSVYPDRSLLGLEQRISKFTFYIAGVEVLHD